MRNLAIIAAATAMLTATVASAQGPPDRERRGGGERAAPQQRAAPERGRAERPQTQMREQRAPRVESPSRQVPSAAQVDRSEERRARRSAERERPVVRERQRERAAVERRQRERPAAEQRQKERPDVSERRRERIEPRRDRAERREERVDRRAEQRREQVERSAVPGRDRVERREGSAERGLERGGDRTSRHEAVRTARVQLTQEQRVRLRDSFDRQRARVTNVRFAARTGTHIPRRVGLYAIPAAVLAIIPAYSAYRYVYYEDYICIVDPGTYEIVDVIEYGPSGPPPGGPQIAALELTAAERELILDSIGPDFPSADIRIGLALGAEVPRAVELFAFPEIVIDRVPKVRSYRFIVVDRDVVIVDPRQREIALVLRR